MDKKHAISIEKQITNDNTLIAYLGKRNTLIDYCRTDNQ